MIGFETIGNATLTVFDSSPVLTTDPWVNGNPYFGSWGHAYSIPNNQLNNIKESKYVWLSHGHPDHADRDSYVHFKGSTILIPDHYGDRIFTFFNEHFDCIKLKSNKWFQISKNVRIKSFSDWNQDASLLVEIMGRDLIANINDGNLRGWSKTVRNIIKNYENKFLLISNNWGDADMINFYDENGNFLLPNAAKKQPVGASYTRLMKNFNCNYAIPFSSFHQFFRKDSIHMNRFSTPAEKHHEDFKDTYGELLPAFVTWDSEKRDFQRINTSKIEPIPIEPEKFGDNYSDSLTKEDKVQLINYFKSIDSLQNHFGSIVFNVGKEDFGIKLSDKNTSLRFEAPRFSLITSIENEIFDDMLIGNFMKTTLIGCNSLHPNFTPPVAKYADNGFAKSEDDVVKYFNYYRINSADYWRDIFKFRTEGIIRSFISPQSNFFKFVKEIKQRFF
tara:strand:- start:965 stop:2302 length:1338 start_codon:yes stop_codon:yes gene_type:complete